VGYVVDKTVMEKDIDTAVNEVIELLESLEKRQHDITEDQRKSLQKVSYWLHIRAPLKLSDINAPPI